MHLTYKQNSEWYSRNHEPPRDKTNNVAVCPTKAQISLGIRPVCLVFAVRSMGI